MEKVRVGLVGEMVYFKCHYGTDLNEFFDVKEFNINPFHDKDWTKLIGEEVDVWIFFRGELANENIVNGLSGKKVCISTEPVMKAIKGDVINTADMEVRMNALRKAKNIKWDLFLHYDETSIPLLKKEFDCLVEPFILPIAKSECFNVKKEKKYDVGFFGRDTPHREKYLGVLKRDFKTLHICHGVEDKLKNDLTNECKIMLNLHHEDSLGYEPRLQQMMACNSFVMSEELSHDKFFIEGKHYVKININNFVKLIKFYLADDKLRDYFSNEAYLFVNKELDALFVWTKLIRRVLTL